SGTHPGPFGMAAHGRDCVAVLDALGTEKGVLIGHSMGAYVATRAAADAPHRTTGLVLVDGGLPLALPDGTDPDTAIDALVGPAVARLALTWAGREELEAFWKAHPALGEWTTWHDAYVAYDVESDPDGALRSRVSETAVRHDGAELFTDPDSGRRVLGSDTPCWMLRAPRGLRDDPAAPLLGQDAIDTLKAARPDVEIVELPPEVNHYSIVLGDTGARAVATAVREAIT
ncbi:MAG: alpha/beta fold hydrolase, partial [Acidimicrobiales bacterium]